MEDRRASIETLQASKGPGPSPARFGCPWFLILRGWNSLFSRRRTASTLKQSASLRQAARQCAQRGCGGGDAAGSHTGPAQGLAGHRPPRQSASNGRRRCVAIRWLFVGRVVWSCCLVSLFVFWLCCLFSLVGRKAFVSLGVAPSQALLSRKSRDGRRDRKFPLPPSHTQAMGQRTGTINWIVSCLAGRARRLAKTPPTQTTQTTMTTAAAAAALKALDRSDATSRFA